MQPELEDLITAALADGKLSPKEREVLFKKAEILGDDKDEFEIELEAYTIQARKQKWDSRLFFFKKNKEALVYVAGGFILILSLFLLIKLNLKSHKIKRFARVNDLEFSNIQDALINYDFENAYQLVSFYEEINYKKAGNTKVLYGTIVDTEVNYLLSEGYISRGLEISTENIVEQDYNREYGISERELAEIVKSNYSILIAKQKFGEALQLLFASVSIQTNELIDNLFIQAVNNNAANFNYSMLLDLYKPLKMWKSLGTKRVKKRTKPIYEERVVTNWLGKAQKDQYGRTLTERVLVSEGGEEYWDDVNVQESYMLNSYRDNAEKILKEKGIKY